MQIRENGIKAWEETRATKLRLVLVFPLVDFDSQLKTISVYFSVVRVQNIAMKFKLNSLNTAAQFS